MKTYSLPRIALLACALAAVGVIPMFAQDQSTPPAQGAPGSQLTDDEKARLKKDQDAVFAANPDLKKEHDDLMSSRPAPDASDADKQAFHDKMAPYHKEMHDAMLKVDPTVGPLLAKADAGHHHGAASTPPSQ